MTDYNFVDPPDLSERERTNILLINAGMEANAYSILTGRVHATLQAAAEEHADFQAELGLQGHHFWGRRVQELREWLPAFHDFKEVCAESWSWNTEAEAAIEMFNSWRQSTGHWAAVNGPCDIYGFAMSFNKRKNIWYACGILASLRLRSSTGRATVL